MNEERVEIIGELSPEDAKRFIDMMSVGSIMNPKMSLEELIFAAREIDNEINMFEARWLDKVDTLTYKDAVNLIFSEIDRYPTIKKYNKDKQETLQFDFMEGLIRSLDSEVKLDWSFVKGRLITTLTPNRWV